MKRLGIFFFYEKNGDVDDFCGFLEFECEISMNSHVNATQKQPEDVSKLKQEIERLNRELAVFKQGVEKRLNKQDLYPTNIYVKNNEVCYDL
jgi:uncharacterized protein YwgA